MRLISRVPRKFAHFYVIATAIVFCASAVCPVTLAAQNPVDTAKKAAAAMAKKLDALQKAAAKAQKDLNDFSQQNTQAQIKQSDTADSKQTAADAAMKATTAAMTAKGLADTAVQKAQDAKTAADSASMKVQAAAKAPDDLNAKQEAGMAVANATSLQMTADMAAMQASAAKAASDQATTVAKNALDPSAQQKRNFFRYRLLGGYEGAIGNSASPKGQYYFEAFATTPLNRKGDRTWGFARITAAPTQVDAPIATFLPALATNLGGVKVNQIGHSGEFMFGYERQMPLSIKVFSISPIVGLGGTTPINPQDNVNVFANDEAQTKQLYPSAVGKSYIAFVPQQRNGTYWQYVAGARFTTFEDLESRIPEATFDLTLGQNQLITGGTFHGAVLRFDAMLNATNAINRIGFPLPLYFFVTGMWKTGAASSSIPIILSQPTSTVAVPGSDVAIIATPPSNLNITRFGVAIDLAKVFAKSTN